MSALLWMALLALDESPIVSDSGQTPAAKRCSAAISSKVNGELSDLSITKSRRIRRTVILNGSVTVLQRPPTIPGEMTPTHVIRLQYYYECRWPGRGKARVRVSLQNN
ncbi:MAG: hypothetical protein QOJ94_2933 [Sphingomonadales bacterium]|jgi:hypothetical protein|nr:hypothetical protein [Sphingomonadales bacterium]